MPDHHWIQISTNSYNILRDLVRTTLVRPSHLQLCGVQDSGTWELTAQADVTILSDACLSIAGQLVEAQLSHLPTHAYRSLVTGSALFTQYEGVDELYRQVRQLPEGWSSAAFARLLEETVRGGRQPDVQPRLVVTPTTYTAQWRPDQVYLRQDHDGDWFLALLFDTRHHSNVRHPAPVPVGLDIGRNPLTVACCIRWGNSAGALELSGTLRWTWSAPRAG